MSLTLTLTGTGGAQGVPAWGCECAACARARRSPQYRRQPCSGVVKFNDAITLIDAGLHDLADRWSPGSFQQFLLTHYPAWGCECAACARARRSPQYRRQPCSGVVKFNDAITLIDAGLHDLADRGSPGSFQQVLLTHYHMGLRQSATLAAVSPPAMQRRREV